MIKESKLRVCLDRVLFEIIIIVFFIMWYMWNKKIIDNIKRWVEKYVYGTSEIIFEIFSSVNILNDILYLRSCKSHKMHAPTSHRWPNGCPGPDGTTSHNNVWCVLVNHRNQGLIFFPFREKVELNKKKWSNIKCENNSKRKNRSKCYSHFTR